MAHVLRGRQYADARLRKLGVVDKGRRRDVLDELELLAADRGHSSIRAVTHELARHLKQRIILRSCVHLLSISRRIAR